MTSTATAEQAAIHLQYVIHSWPQLTRMLTTRHTSTWPPVMGIQHVLDDQDDPDEVAEQRAALRLAERADSRYTLGSSPAPIRLHIVDVMRTIETDLVYLADIIATEVQRPPISNAPAHWLPAEQEKRNKIAAEDAADWRRWRYRQHRSAVYAAAWLSGRLDGEPGPFLPLGPSRLARIATAAKTAHDQIQQALNGVRTAQVVDRPCPLCGGTLGISSGDGEEPLVVCFGCQQQWQLPSAVEAA